MSARSCVYGSLVNPFCRYPDGELRHYISDTSVSLPMRRPSSCAKESSPAGLSLWPPALFAARGSAVKPPRFSGSTDPQWDRHPAHVLEGFDHLLK